MKKRQSKSELEKEREALQRMYVELDTLQFRIAKQKRIVAMMTQLADAREDSGPPVGLVTGITDACKSAVLAAHELLTPAQVRDRIKILGIPEQKNLLASVHTVLKRLAKAGEIKAENGMYRRITSEERSAALDASMLAAFMSGSREGAKQGQKKPKAFTLAYRPSAFDADDK